MPNWTKNSDTQTFRDGVPTGLDKLEIGDTIEEKGTKFLVVSFRPEHDPENGELCINVKTLKN